MRDACLVVVDAQNDFMPGGALAVPRGDEVVPVINSLATRFENVVLMAGSLRAGNSRCRHPFPAGRSESPLPPTSASPGAT